MKEDKNPLIFGISPQEMEQASKQRTSGSPERKTDRIARELSTGVKGMRDILR